ncbi:MAG: IS110 family transposase [Bacteroidota bacterium]
MSSKKTKREVVKQNVGVDISKDDFKVCFYCLDQAGHKFIKGSRTFKNTLAGFTAFMKWIEKKRQSNVTVRITIEATGVYHENLVHFLDDNGYYVSVILANQSKAYAGSLNLKTKTDEVDAKMLGQMGIERDLSQWKRASPKMRTLKQLTRDRLTLVKEKTALSNRLHALNASFEPDKRAIRRLKQRLKLLYKQIKEVEKEIQQTIKEDEVLKGKVENITKIKGLALVTVATVIAETNGFNLFTSRNQLISYAGYDVVQRESGSSVKGVTRISKKGNSHIRRALHFPALSAVKHETQFKQLFERVLDRSGIKMKGYVAVQRKLLILIYTLFKNNVAYDPNYQNDKKDTEELADKEVDKTPVLPTVDACSKATSLVA